MQVSIIIIIILIYLFCLQGCYTFIGNAQYFNIVMILQKGGSNDTAHILIRGLMCNFLESTFVFNHFNRLDFRQCFPYPFISSLYDKNLHAEITIIILKLIEVIIFFSSLTFVCIFVFRYVR